MDESDLERALATVRHMRANPNLVKMEAWIERTSCGTVGCFAGWHALLAGCVPLFDEALAADTLRVRTPSGDDALCDAYTTLDLGLTNRQAQHVFTHCWTIDEVEEALRAFAAGDTLGCDMCVNP